ncbi:CD276 antigen homolog [Pimephales promelas]|uniref:CD276 antigen homolog n=1 Tax=Pimephales promelas TaxID=90988 RepID=UPI0019559817|nr:CD276 antigen homolog [Pimephales promelas]KAG1927257.1 butyrophilin-like protein [Pimephales promelas]
MIRCCIVLLLLLTLHEVSLQEPIVGFIGDSAVLPCFSKEHRLELQDITVRWRYNDSLNVYDIIDGKGSVDDQHLAYKKRVETFPDGFEKGNFTLKINNLQNNDTGKYVCYATEIQSVDLLVKVKEKSIQKNNQTEGKSNQGAQSRPEKIMTAVPLLSVFILLRV